MIGVRIKKIFSDYLVRWGRTILTFGGLALGLFGVGSILTAFLILSDDLRENFVRTNPARIIAVTGDIDSQDVEALGHIPGVTQAEERRRLMARVEAAPGQWMSMLIFVVDDFDDMRIARFYPESGAWPPPPGAVLIERDGRFFLRREKGSPLRIRLPDGQIVETVYEGTVYDPGQAPSRMERLIYGYVTRATYDAWKLKDPSGRVLLTVADDRQEVASAAGATSRHAGQNGGGPTAARRVADHIGPVLEYHGKELKFVSVLDADKQPHQFQMDAIRVLLGGLLLVSFLLSAALTVNLVDSILVAETRQIGIMKALGARRIRLAADYLGGIALLGGLAAAAGAAFAIRSGENLAQFISRFLNFEILTEPDRLTISVIVVSAGIAIPAAAAFGRVIRVAALPARKALEGAAATSFDVMPALIARSMTFLPAIPRMAFRNLFRRPRRVLLTALIICAGLLAFLSALNIRSSLMETVEAVKRTKLHDLSLSFTDSVPHTDLQNWIDQFQNIRAVEFWSVSVGTLRRGRSFRSNPIVIRSVPPETEMLKPDLISGSWLNPQRRAGIVVTQKLLADYPNLKVGGAFQLQVESWSGPVEIIGIVKEFGPGLIYVSQSFARQWAPESDRSNLMLVSLDVGSFDIQAKTARAMEASLLEMDWHIFRILRIDMLEAIVRNHVDVIARVLEIIAAAMLIVGLLGLSSSIGVNVIERYREIGVLKAVGGRSAAIRWLFMWEAIFIAFIGWVVAQLAAPLLSREISAIFGTLIIQYPFDYRAAPLAAPVALSMAIAIAVLASVLPARAATRCSVQKALQSV